MSTSTYYSWNERHKQPNRHAGQTPKCHWITEAEQEAIIAYYLDHQMAMGHRQSEGYRRLT